MYSISWQGRRWDERKPPRSLVQQRSVSLRKLSSGQQAAILDRGKEQAIFARFANPGYKSIVGQLWIALGAQGTLWGQDLVSLPILTKSLFTMRQVSTRIGEYKQDRIGVTCDGRV